MYKKLVCILLLISITLTACDSGVGNNVGGTPITRNKVVSNAPATKPVVEVSDKKSGEYDFSYSPESNIGVLENALAYKGMYYFTRTGILWINENRKMKGLANIKLNKSQLSSYNGFISFVQQHEREFKVLYPKLTVISVIPATMEPLSKNVYINTYMDESEGKKQLLKYDLLNGTCEIVQDKLEDSDNSLDNIATVQIKPTKILLKTIDLSNNIVTDGATIPFNTDGKANINASVSNYGSQSQVIITYNQGGVDEDGASNVATIDQSFLCTTKDKTCTKDIQILSVPSTAQVNDSVPISMINLFNDYAESEGLSIDSYDSSNPQGVSYQPDWPKIFTSLGVWAVLALFGVWAGYHYNGQGIKDIKNDYTKYIFEKFKGVLRNEGIHNSMVSDKIYFDTKFLNLKGIENITIWTSDAYNDAQWADIAYLQKNLKAREVVRFISLASQKNYVSFEFYENMFYAFKKSIADHFFDYKTSHDELSSLYKQYDLLSNGEKYIDNNTLSADDLKMFKINHFKILEINGAEKDKNITADNITDFNKLITDYNNATDKKSKITILDCILNSKCSIDTLRSNGVIRYLTELNIGYNYFYEFYVKMRENFKNSDVLSDAPKDIKTFVEPDQIIQQDVAIEKIKILRLKYMKVAATIGTGLAGIVITKLYNGPFDKTFMQTVVISEPSCNVAGNCSTGTVYDSDKQPINDEDGNPAFLDDGYVQKASFTDQEFHNNYSISLYRLSNAMTCEQLNTNFTDRIKSPTYVEVNGQLKVIVDVNANICNASHAILNPMITCVDKNGHTCNASK